MINQLLVLEPAPCFFICVLALHRLCSICCGSEISNLWLWGVHVFAIHCWAFVVGFVVQIIAQWVPLKVFQALPRHRWAEDFCVRPHCWEADGLQGLCVNSLLQTKEHSKLIVNNQPITSLRNCPSPHAHSRSKNTASRSVLCCGNSRDPWAQRQSETLKLFVPLYRGSILQKWVYVAGYAVGDHHKKLERRSAIK